LRQKGRLKYLFRRPVLHYPANSNKNALYRHSVRMELQIVRSAILKNQSPGFPPAWELCRVKSKTKSALRSCSTAKQAEIF